MNLLNLLSPSYLGRYRDLAVLVVKHGGRDLLDMVGLASLAHHDDDDAPPGVRPEAAELANDLEKLGPAFIKLGQTLAGQADLLPDDYLVALSRLQDDVEPMGFETAIKVVEESLGQSLEKLYATFEPEPLGSASLGQVHAATLPDGTAVVVKVQRPDVRKAMNDDLDALASLAGLLDEHTDIGRQYRFGKLISQLRRSLDRELDYEREAAQLVNIGKLIGEFDRLTTPVPDPERTTARVLTMTRLDGVSVDQFSQRHDHAAQDDASFGNGEVLLDDLFHAYLRQVLVSGTFHADPHPGNVLILHDGRLGLIDFGQTGFVEPAMRDRLLRLLLAISEGRITEAADIAIDLGQPAQDFDSGAFRRRLTDAISEHHQASFRQMHSGRLVAAVCRCGNESGLHIPESITLLGKMLLNLDQVARHLAPDFDTNASLKKHGLGLATRQFTEDVSLTRLLTKSLSAKTFIEDLPTRVNRALDIVADNRLRVEVDAIDENRLIWGLKAIANRIGVALIVLALLVSGAIMLQTDPGFTIFGYSGLGILALGTAVLLIVFFAVMVLWKDFRDGHGF